jgi:Lon protease-like protein
MAAFHPNPHDLPAEIPVFPLEGALLLPRAQLPLNIFEPRYLAMTEDALAAGRMFGMVQPDPALPATPTGPALYRIGCLGRLSAFAETEDGRFLITLTGVIRFQVAEEIDMHRGYRRVRFDYSTFYPDLNLTPRPLGLNRQVLIAALRGYFHQHGLKADWEAIGKIADDKLVTTLALSCPFRPAEKQALLECPTDSDRAQTLLALLQIGAAEDMTAHPPR